MPWNGAHKRNIDKNGQEDIAEDINLYVLFQCVIYLLSVNHCETGADTIQASLLTLETQYYYLHWRGWLDRKVKQPTPIKRIPLTDLHLRSRSLFIRHSVQSRIINVSLCIAVDQICKYHQHPSTENRIEAQWSTDSRQMGWWERMRSRSGW